YSGVVKKQLADDEGAILVHSDQYGSSEDDPETWIVCQPGNQLFSFIVPDVDDVVEFYFPQGTDGRSYYIRHDPFEMSTSNGGLRKFVVCEYAPDIHLLYDKAAESLALANGELSVVLHANNSGL